MSPPTPPDPKTPEPKITCEFTTPCTTTPIDPHTNLPTPPLRKVISHIFGRNKTATKQFPTHVWVHYCRKHYQRARYRSNQWPFTQCELLGDSLRRMERWGGVRFFDLVLRRREVERLGSSSSASPSSPSRGFSSGIGSEGSEGSKDVSGDVFEGTGAFGAAGVRVGRGRRGSGSAGSGSVSQAQAQAQFSPSSSQSEQTGGEAGKSDADYMDEDDDDIDDDEEQDEAPSPRRLRSSSRNANANANTSTKTTSKGKGKVKVTTTTKPKAKGKAQAKAKGKPKPKGQGKTTKSKRKTPQIKTAPVPDWLHAEVGPNKTFAEIRNMLHRLWNHMEAQRNDGLGDQIRFPDIEILPTFYPWVKAAEEHEDEDEAEEEEEGEEEEEEGSSGESSREDEEEEGEVVDRRVTRASAARVSLKGGVRKVH